MIAYASEAACVAQGFLDKLNDLVLFPLITLLLAVAFLWFLYGGFLYIAKADQSGEREKGRKHMLFGVIGLVVMTTAGAILAIAANSIPGFSEPAGCVEDDGALPGGMFDGTPG